ncbi:hypothetical protein BSZ19_03760 [Bradyrhizobium japonicum]|uniref:Uncharacterized protein n=1 Tax=Bradyrhizobium japonicum TaxID=375 RepID=A0A1Y2JZB6_BRAJP|nr:hypothetical protein BSZ19_03760 [Bradyrhizobium japonicum]
MAESFGSSFSVVQVTADDTTTQIWIALAKPSQALTLVLAARYRFPRSLSFTHTGRDFDYPF